jgi:hypothetical protein
MKKLLLSLLFIIPFTGYAQVQKPFSTDAPTFFKEIKAYLELTNKKETEKLTDRFELVWLEQPKFTADQQTTVVKTCNDMLKKRLKPFPDFSNYIEALIGFSESGKSGEMFTKWHSSLDKMLFGKTKYYSDYIEICSGLFSGNILYQSASTKWTAGTSNFIFDFDSVPKVNFPAMNLTCYAKSDSSVIYNIQGVYYPLIKKFYGTGGKINWMRAGIPEDEAYANLKNTIIDVTSSIYTSDSADFYNKKFFKTALMGKVTDKILANADSSNATYPRFQSYDANLTIKELIKDADYVGGFSQQGAKMIGAGSKDQKATLNFKRNNKIQLSVQCKSFVVRPERLSAQNATAIIYFEDDSIYHPSLDFKYVNKDRQVSLIIDNSTGMSMPFFNSFHKVDIYVDGIYWKIDDPLMELKMISGAGESKMWLESENLFSDDRFRQLQGLSDYNPLQLIYKYNRSYGDVIYSATLAQMLGVAESEAKSLMIFLANKGFLTYDAETSSAVAKDKVVYYLEAKTEKIDYDKIEISSLISAKPNAKLNLLNFDLDMEGVSRVFLSDTQAVWVTPENQQIKLKKNRDFEFSGKVHAGRSDFFGKKFEFIYDQFKFNLATIDSIRLKVVSDSELDEKGNPKLIPLKSTLQNVSGVLYIDSLNNKSSRKSYSQYPKFVSDKESYVYYDHRSIYGGVYDRDKFYFKIEPFTIDSLDNFSSGGMKFAGTFVSGGIFPDIKEMAVIRPDYSFGFERNSPSEGYPMYNGKGTFTNHIDLSYAGLLGDGKVDYLSSSSTSKEIVFFIDSTNMQNAAFDLRKETIAGVGFPDAQGKQNAINWRPYKDEMYVYMTTDPIAVYNKQVSLTGNLLLASKGLGGNGDARFDASNLIARNLWFKQDAYGSDTADFKLKSDIESVLAIETKNVNAKIDLVNRFGNFLSNGKGSYVSFPLNQYICYIAQFKWFIDKNEVEFGDENADKTKLNIEGSDFVSTNAFQDSLRWNAGLARYNLNDYLIKARKVKEILVADASIQPNDTATIVIEKDAYMRPLLNAKVIANVVSKYHTITGAQLQIKGRKEYEGTGQYAYNDHAGTPHLISLERIGVDTAKQTYANGNIPETENFQLSTNIQYKGRVQINASNPLLNFDGFASVKHLCTAGLSINWFGFKSDIDIKNLTIPVDEPRNENGERLGVGIFLSSDSSGYYAGFISPKEKNSDSTMVAVKGYLSYNDKANSYYIASKEKISNPDLPGNSISLNNDSCYIIAEGELNPGFNFGQLQTTFNGRVIYNPLNDSTSLDVLLGLDFMFNNDALKLMSESITSNSTLKPTNDTRSIWTRSMRAIVGTEKADKMVSEFALYGAPKKVPQELQQALYLTDLKMYWNKNSQSFKSVGPIGIGFIDKNTISRQLTGYFEIQKKKNGDVLNLYFEADQGNWWYFTYSRGILQSCSSDIKFNDAINNMKPDKRIADKKGDLPSYEYILSTDRKKNEFKTRFSEPESEE